MIVRVRLFASLREIVGSEELDLEPEEGTTVSALWEQILDEHPDLSRYRNAIQFAVNQDFVSGESLLKDKDEVAFLPPVSGG